MGAVGLVWKNRLGRGELVWRTERCWGGSCVLVGIALNLKMNLMTVRIKALLSREVCSAEVSPG